MTNVQQRIMTPTAQTTLQPFQLHPFFSQRPWGREHLRPWYPSTGTSERVGEAWLTGPTCLVETGPLTGKTLADIVHQYGPQLLGERHHLVTPPEFPLLVKLLFPEDKLSVQVHPDDIQAKAMNIGRGKTECWYVLEAEPGAAVALGLRPNTTAAQVRAAVADGNMEDLLNMLPVSPGDMVFVDAGTIHAIGPGVVLLETQQMSDNTFRMYDYGRPRDLHLDQALAVMNTSTRAGKVAPRPMPGFTRLIEEQYFTVDRFEASTAPIRLETITPACLIAITGSGTLLTSPATLPLSPGRAIVLPANSSVTIQPEANLTFLRCTAP